MPITVRDGKKVWPTCPECGCRLQRVAGFWGHFIGKESDNDARGCKCKYVSTLWDLND